MQHEQGSFKNKLRQTLCFYCCFRSHRRETLSSPSSSDRATLLRTSSVWIKSRAQELPEVISRIGRHHRRKSSSDFRYDPLSYALNFDDSEIDDYEVPLRNFSTRAPASPPLKAVQEVDEMATPAVSREITCA